MEAHVSSSEAARGGASLIAAEVSGALLLCAGAAGAAVLASVLGAFRMMQLNSIFAESDTATLAPWWVLALGTTVGALIASAAAVVYTVSSRAFPRAPGPFTTVLVGVAIGLWMGCSQWAEPQDIGLIRDPEFGGSVAWSAPDWLWYHSQWALPAAATVLALPALVAGRLLRRLVTAASERSED